MQSLVGQEPSEGRGGGTYEGFQVVGWVGGAGQQIQTGEVVFDEVGEEPLEISTSMTPHTAAVLGECFQFLGSCLYGLDL